MKTAQSLLWGLGYIEVWVLEGDSKTGQGLKWLWTHA